MDSQICYPRLAREKMGLRRLVHWNRAGEWALQYWSRASMLMIQQLFGAGETITLLLQVKYGRGRHSDEVPLEDLDKMTMVSTSDDMRHTVTDQFLVQVHQHVAVLLRKLGCKDEHSRSISSHVLASERTALVPTRSDSMEHGSSGYSFCPFLLSRMTLPPFFYAPI